MAVNISKDGYSERPITFVRVRVGAAETHDFELSRRTRQLGGQLALPMFLMPVHKNQSDPSAADGSFAIDGPAPGEYSFEIDPPSDGRISSRDQKPDATGYGPTWFPNVPRMDMAAPVTLAGGENRALELRIQKRELHRIAGSLEGPAGVAIEVAELTGAR